MILYEAGGLSILLKTAGSVFPRTIPWGIFSALIGISINLLHLQDDVEQFFGHPYAHQVFAISMGFLLVFRANLSYARFWEGRTQVQQMSTKWDDGAMQIACFEEVSSCPDGALFTYRMVHLFSLLHALCIMILRGDADLDHLVEETPVPSVATSLCGLVTVTTADDHHDESSREYLRVIGGVSTMERKFLESHNSRCYAVMFWIMQAVTRRHVNGKGLKVPSPIMSRTYHVLSDGMGNYMQARKIHDTPFPFPYAQLLVGILLLFVITAPIVIFVYAQNLVFASALTFMSVVSAMALNEVAKEIEDPFGYDPNDLPLKALHEQFNQRIEELLSPAESTVFEDIPMIPELHSVPSFSAARQAGSVSRSFSFHDKSQATPLSLRELREKQTKMCTYDNLHAAAQIISLPSHVPPGETGEIPSTEADITTEMDAPPSVLPECPQSTDLMFPPPTGSPTSAAMRKADLELSDVLQFLARDGLPTKTSDPRRSSDLDTELSAVLTNRDVLSGMDLPTVGREHPTLTIQHSHVDVNDLNNLTFEESATAQSHLAPSPLSHAMPSLQRSVSKAQVRRNADAKSPNFRSSTDVVTQ
mmetsp:Transcript_17814/g.41963  ORF Transcript_17814/g.41963 Transcript_17814/m.41963 type:complete len:589 (-) Transcript_17814:312-2078(-)